MAEKAIARAQNTNARVILKIGPKGILHNGPEDNTCDACHDLNHVVGDAAELHLPRLGDQIVVHLVRCEVKKDKA
jgi:hypothetical protein